jgi:hypothetical protein
MKAAAFNFDSAACKVDLELAKKSEPKIYDFLAAIDKTHQVVWLSDAICTDDSCNASINGIPIYRDAGHLTVDGSELIGQRLRLGEMVSVVN